ncbi:MAG: TetR family transcriptional regulator [Parvibaculaceae bacterium]|nr:TetR family transcriptional regulator [Parvibaculaceae bacterium]
MTALPEQASSREVLILAAERLFAESGLHGVSLRQINDAAGQRNTSAIQYHFGNRDALAKAVFVHRMQHINPRRDALLDEMSDANGLTDLRGLIGAMAWPLAEELKPRPEGNYFLRFLAQTAREEGFAVLTSAPHLSTGRQRATEAISALISYLPPKIHEIRVMTIGEMAINALAVFEADGSGKSSDLEFKVEALIDMIAASVLAPISTQTLKAYKQSL